MATASELIAQADAATTAAEVDAIEAQAEGRVTVLNAVADARARLAQPPTETPAETTETPATETPEPDFVWVGCSECWTPQDTSRQVRPYQEWLNAGHRYLSYFCATCTERRGTHTEVHPTLWAFWLENAKPFHEGGIAAEATEVKRWGV